MKLPTSFASLLTIACAWRLPSPFVLSLEAQAAVYSMATQRCV
jgi:hypothetical protein